MMKRLVTIAIVLFCIIYAAIIVVGAAQHLTIENTTTSTPTSPVPTSASVKAGTSLDAATVSQHNNASDCWMIIDNKVYNITGYFGSHPGGDMIMVNFCGKEASTAYHFSPHRHSSYATSLLSGYLLGGIGTTISGN